MAEALGIIVCLIASAFFSGSETALTSLSRAQAQKLYEQEEMGSLKLWLDKPIHVLTAILIGNNIFNITASALATDLADRLLRGTAAANWAIPVAVGVMTFLLLTFGEITPKAIAKKMYKSWVGRSMTLLRLPILLFKIPTLFFTFMTRGIMRALGSDPNVATPFVTAEEIEFMIDLGSREGTFTGDSERMLRSVFEFKDTIVKEIMVPRTEMVVLNTGMSLEEIVEIFNSCGHSRIPVFHEGIDDIVGIFYAKDLLEQFFREPTLKLDVNKMLRKPIFVPGSKHVSDLLNEFQGQRIHMAIVVDEFGGTDGLVTLEDIVEEFFGEIQDEYDAEPDQLTSISDTIFEADGKLPIYELEQTFDVQLPDDANYETLGGFLMSSCGSVPQVGYEMVWQHLTFTVLEADETHVISAKIEQQPPSQEVLEALLS